MGAWPSGAVRGQAPKIGGLWVDAETSWAVLSRLGRANTPKSDARVAPLRHVSSRKAPDLRNSGRELSACIGTCKQRMLAERFREPHLAVTEPASDISAEREWLEYS